MWNWRDGNASKPIAEIEVKQSKIVRKQKLLKIGEERLKFKENSLSKNQELLEDEVVPELGEIFFIHIIFKKGQIK